MEAERQRNWIPRDVQGLVTCDPHIQRGIKSVDECEFCNVNYVAHRQLSIERDRRHSLEERQHQLLTHEGSSTSPITMEQTRLYNRQYTV